MSNDRESTYTDFAIALLDHVIGEGVRPDHAQEERKALSSLGASPWQGAGVATRGCPKCKGTMYRTQERGGGSQWVCRACGHVV